MYFTPLEGHDAVTQMKLDECKYATKEDLLNFVSKTILEDYATKTKHNEDVAEIEKRQKRPWLLWMAYTASFFILVPQIFLERKEKIEIPKTSWQELLELIKKWK